MNAEMIVESAPSIASSAANATEWPGLPAEYHLARWYAAYTSANHEKRVAVQLEERAVEHFLPLYESVRRWKDRRMNLQLPLFPGYVFVRLALRDRLKVLQVPGVARLVGFNGRPCALPEREIEAMQMCLSRGAYLEPYPYLKTGRKVCIKKGPLEGCEGILLRRKGACRVVLSIELITRSIVADVDATDLEPSLH